MIYIYKYSITNNGIINVKMVQTITLTFGDAGENHVGMEMIGEKGNIGDGFNKKDLENIIKRMNLLGLNKQIELYYINELLDEEKRKNTEEAYKKWNK